MNDVGNEQYWQKQLSAARINLYEAQLLFEQAQSLLQKASDNANRARTRLEEVEKRAGEAREEMSTGENKMNQDDIDLINECVKPFVDDLWNQGHRAAVSIIDSGCCITIRKVDGPLKKMYITIPGSDKIQSI